MLWTSLKLKTESPDIAWFPFYPQENKTHNNVSLVMGHFWASFQSKKINDIGKGNKSHGNFFFFKYPNVDKYIKINFVLNMVSILSSYHPNPYYQLKTS